MASRISVNSQNFTQLLRHTEKEPASQSIIRQNQTDEDLLDRLKEYNKFSKRDLGLIRLLKVKGVFLGLFTSFASMYVVSFHVSFLSLKLHGDFGVPE